MNQGDDRRPVWVLLAVLTAVVAGIVAVSMVGGTLTHQTDRGATPSIPAVRTSTTTTPSPTPTTIYLEPADTFDPLSTSVGTIQFSTWRLPQNWEDPRWITATAHGVVAVQLSGWHLVWSNDGTTWSEIPVSIKPQRLVTHGDDLIVYNHFGATRLTWNGTQWVEQEPLGIDGADQLVVGPKGIVAILEDHIFHSADGTEFQPTEQPPNRDTPQNPTESRCLPTDGLGRVVATNDGFITTTPRLINLWFYAPTDVEYDSIPECGPLAWSSTDGNTWELVSDASPFDPDASVYDYDFTTWAGHLVAVGAIGLGPAVWMSSDGLSWEHVDVEVANAEKIAAGGRGWILLGETEPDVLEPGQMWFSIDGITWDGPYERPDGWSDPWFIDAAMLDDRIIGRGHGEVSDPDGSYASFIVVGEFIDDGRADKPLVLTPVDWQIELDDAGPGIHTLHMIVDARPLDINDGARADLSGRLVWDETVVDLCRIAIRKSGDDYLHVGDIFQTTEGCGDNPTAMQDAFDEYGIPDTACVIVTVDGVDHEYCSPLN